MSIRALTCDTGGTILDWHNGLHSTFAAIGAERGIEGDWAKITNEYRRRSLEGMVDAIRPERNIDEVNRRALDTLCPEFGLAAFTEADKDRIARTWHALDAWPECPAAMKRLRTKCQVVALTILTTALVIDVSRKNNIDWDCVISCEMIGIYKRRPEAYKTAAKWLQLDPSEIMMVAAHNSDLLAARACGFRSAFIRRPTEWGPEGQPVSPIPDPVHDIIANDFADLATTLGV